MTSAVKTQKKHKNVLFHFSLPIEMMDKVKEKAEQLQAAAVPGTTITSSDVIRQAIWAFVQ